MRVSTNMLTLNFMISLNKSLERQNDLQEKLADGKDIHRPSDDPVKTIRSMRFNINLRENEQYTQHVKDALSWMETTDSAMSDLSSLTISAKELIVKAVAPNPDMALDAIADELDGIINQMIQVGNTKIGDRYVFAGQEDKTEPFKRRMVTVDTGLPAPNDKAQTEAVVYSGDTNKISMRIQPGIVTPSQDSVNLTGEDVFGPFKTLTENNKPVQTVDILNNLIKIKEALTGKPSPKSNPAGGNISQFSTEEHKAFTLKIDQTDPTGLPTKASYSIDGGQTWQTASPVLDASSNPIPGRFEMKAADMGTVDPVQYQFGTNNSKNQVGDTYTLPQATTERDLKWLSKVGLALAENGHTHILQAQTGIGARMSMYEQAKALLEKNNVTITGDVAANEDLDVPKAMVDFKTSESIYRTALSIGARLMPPSLVDFLK